ncbi:MAG: hypothetical protein ACKO3S_09280 [bacterium]
MSSLITDVDEEALFDFVRKHLADFHGLRANRVSLPGIRQRLAAMVRSTDPPRPDVLDVLRRGTLHQRVFMVLSWEAISHSWPELQVYFHDGHPLASLLVDLRGGVVRFALERLQAGDLLKVAPSAEERRAAARTLRAKFGLFIEDWGGILAEAGEGGGVLTKEHEEELAQLRAEMNGVAAKCAAANKELHRLRERHEEAERAHAQQIQQWQEKFDAMKRSRDEAVGQVGGIVADRDALRVEFEARVQAAVERQLDERIRPWLRPVEELEAMRAAVEADRARGEDVIQHAEKVLEAQQQRDRSMGNRAELAARLTRVRELELAIESARQNALSPLPDLGEVALELRREVRAIEAKLGGVVQGFAYEDLISRINAIEDQRQFEALSAFVEQGAVLKVWSVEHERALHWKLDDRCCLLMDRFQREHPTETIRPTPLHRLRQVMEQDVECTLWVDGHNLAFARHGQLFEQGVEGARDARDRVTNALGTIPARNKQMRVNLCFDGPNYSEHFVTPQLRVVFSGGTGLNRADKCILEELGGRVATDPGHLCFLVTSDEGLRHQARGLGPVEVLRCLQFERLLGSA